jgi:Uma2 family endonuclease
MSVSVPRTEPVTPAEPVDGTHSIPPLKEGDRLTRDEFERRYDAMPHLKKAELIEGVVHMPSPVRQRHHSAPHSSLVGWLFLYRARTPGVESGDNPSVRLDLGNMPQPDAVLFIQPEYQGQIRIDEDDYINGAPDLVAEVAASSEGYDLHDKLPAYQRNGVREYIVWRVLKRQVDWFVLREAGYEALVPAEDGILRSTVFPGLWLDPAALVRGDFDTLLDVLQRGLDSPEHAEFAARLQRAKIEPAS